MTPGFNGDGKAIRDSLMYNPLGVKFAPDGTPWVLDWNNHCVRKVVNGKFVTVIGSPKGFPGDGDPNNADLTSTGAPGTSCKLNHPTDLAFKPDGTVILDAWHNHKIRLIDPTSGTEWVLSGRGGGFSGDDGPYAKALYNQEKAIALAADGTLYILDQRNQRIRRVDGQTQVITTIAGTGKQGFAGDGGDPLQAQLNFETGDSPLPSGALLLDKTGKLLYVADSLNHRIRVIDFQANTIQTIVGNGTAGFAGDNGPALQAELNDPKGLAWGPDGRLYIADTENSAIRAVDLTTGIITTVAGTGKRGSGAELQLATKIELSMPYSVDFDPQGNMYVSDSYNNRILRVAR